MGFRQSDSFGEAAKLIQSALKSADSYQQGIARRLFESACLDGLEKFAASGSLPGSFLGYFQKAMHLFDESIRLSLHQLREAGLTVRCSPECSHCCYQMPTGVSTAELVYLYQGVQQSGAASRFFRRCLEAEELWVEVSRRQTNGSSGAGDTPGIYESTSQSYHDLEYRCPFLDDRMCRVYQYRPFACRMHFSLTPPYWCRSTHFQNPNALEFNLEPADCVLDALQELDRRFQLNLSDVMVCGLLEMTVNVMQFKKIHWY